MISALKSKRCLFCLIVMVLLVMAGRLQAASGRARLFAYFTVHQWDLDYIADRYSMVIWHNHPRSVASLPVLREKNPQITALLYRELFCVLKEETQLAESVGQYEWIMANHPEWFQRDIHGNIIEVPDYPGRVMMDLGNPQWQEFWIQETLNDVKEGLWDGVFVDDALTNLKAHDLPRLQNYPDDASLQSAVYGFLKKAYAAFRAEGKLMLANVSNSYDYPGLFERWLEVTDGIMEEHCSGDSWTWGPHVGEAQFEAMQTARAADKWYLCMTYGFWEDDERMGLSLATYLVGSGGKTGWSYRPDRESPKRIPVDPDWIQDIGAPIEDPYHDGGVWSRGFEGGTLFVNPAGRSRPILYLGEEHTIAPHSYKKFLHKDP